jgi:hypothetical protein
MLPGCSDERFAKIVRENLTISGTVRALGRAVVGSSLRLVRREIERLGLDTAHWKWAHTNKPKSAGVLVENSSHSTGLAKRIILREGLLPNECVLCGLGPEWNGRSLVLRLDHKNGKRSDHRLTNLRFLCPNCDSQTDTFCGRNKQRTLANSCACGRGISRGSAACRPCARRNRPDQHKIEWPPVEEIQRRIEASSCLAVATELGVSNSAVTKHLRTHARVVEGGGL